MLVSGLQQSDLDLIDRVPDELWNEVRDIVQETGIKTIPMEKKCKKAKWLSAEALQIAVKRREAKSKGEKERYTHLNAEFQRIARRDKKAFLSTQCKEIEENNRMGKTKDLFKESRDTKGTFHAKMGSIKDRNGMDLREAEDIWNSSTGIPSPPLALFIVMLSKAHLASHSRMSGSSEWSHHRDYLGREDLFCTVLLCILAISS